MPPSPAGRGVSIAGCSTARVDWIIALLATIEMRALLVSLMRAVCALPIAFFALALVGTLCTDASWGARLYAVSQTANLLILPLLLCPFERSSRGVWVF